MNVPLLILQIAGLVAWAVALAFELQARRLYRTALAKLQAAQRGRGTGRIGEQWLTGDGVPFGPGAAVWTPARESEADEAQWECVTVMFVGLETNIVLGTTPCAWNAARPNWMLYADRPEWPAGEAAAPRERQIAEFEAKKTQNAKEGPKQ